MARDTNARIEANLRNPGFKKLLEEAKLMVQRGKYGDAAYHVLRLTNLKKDENENNIGLIKIRMKTKTISD